MTAHDGQGWKGRAIPYTAHLLGVCSLTLEYGGDTEMAAAALLHDTVEDQGGQARLDDIRKHFGKRVALIVEDCTDTLDRNIPWKSRKSGHVVRLTHASQEALLVVLCDKIHNLRSVLADENSGELAVWNRLSGGFEGTLWYYGEVASVANTRVHEARQLRAPARELELLIQQARAPPRGERPR